MRELITLGTPPLVIILRCIVIYLFLLVALRLTGKRQLGQFTPFDFAILLIVSNAVQNAMIGPDTSLIGGMIGAATLFGLNYLLSALSARFSIFGRELLGEPTLLVDDGHLITENLRRERIDPDDVLMAMREHGVDSLTSVKHAILETDGSISIVSADTPVTRTKRRVRGRGHRIM
ncbi:MAG TPA: YetF domain-containing protein [Ktedonobacterales bacterium]|nr:YetF domain-containing protein [Ktedonobacterales bacterium]